MNRSLLYAGFVLAALSFGIGYSAGSGGLSGAPSLERIGPAASEDGITCFFSPRGGCTDAVVAEIERAKNEIDVQAYEFTSNDIAAALVAAHRRGVKLTVILDASALRDGARRRDGNATVETIIRERIDTYVDAKHKIAHNKIMLIDGQTIITGSFNFTYAAEHNNAENLLILHGRPKLYAAYKRNFDEHLGHSPPYNSADWDSPRAETRRR